MKTLLVLFCIAFAIIGVFCAVATLVVMTLLNAFIPDEYDNYNSDREI